MNKFGVCNYNNNAYIPQVTNLIQFDTYDEAFDNYIEKYIQYTKNEPIKTSTLWIVWIEDNKIIQFEQLMKNIRCKIVNL